MSVATATKPTTATQASVTVYTYSELGHANHGWLDARHHFSFARYYNPERLGFGSLLVVNDDTVAGGMGFGTHPHENMEIITYVRQGAITHKDSMGNEGRTGAGDVQVMSVGTGVFHSEQNREHEDTRLYQIWIEPNQLNVTPRWEAKAFPKAKVSDKLAVLVSGREEDKDSGALFIHADAAIYAGKLAEGTTLTQTVKHRAYVLASVGIFTVNGVRLKQGDGAEVTGTDTLTITTTTDAEILVIDAPEHARN